MKATYFSVLLVSSIEHELCFLSSTFQPYAKRKNPQSYQAIENQNSNRDDKFHQQGIFRPHESSSNTTVRFQGETSKNTLEFPKSRSADSRVAVAKQRKSQVQNSSIERLTSKFEVPGLNVEKIASAHGLRARSVIARLRRTYGL